ncbi:MAG TPA: DNA-binding protein [Methanomassiliicoccales archaeon]|jgi:programmed cell death protein 5|nr:DNA-binding protein [Euryarchaeota archaeon]HOE52769.1 DNA-binding protein [Methanomassiliicoccales archaeon]HOO04727.1 DNA-binding protein [Methanomassiliicoccales archaeon]HPD09293.1 DNA-binding protein [Methanomassiliicoccales archaeon]HQM66623.1 DNA-binding protein [Methanomassiliicoccales archaeon]
MPVEDAELEELRRRKMAELQRQGEQQAVMEQQAQAIEAQRQAILRQLLTPEARDRLANVRLAYPEIARTVEDQLIRLAQMGQISSQIDDQVLKQILRKVSPQKREINIERK